MTEYSMINPQQHIAVIPARGGSKRLPGKNLMPIAGKPLIAWTIEAALASKVFDRVIVSTDSPEIAEVSRKYGAEVPFLRPDELAEDQTTTMDVLVHLILQLKQNKDFSYSHLTLLQPTSPLREAKNITDAVKFFSEKQADAVISICKTEHSPLWSNTLPKDNNLIGFLSKDIQKTRSQNLPDYYRLNGALYICEINRMLEEKTLYLSSSCYGFVMSRKNSIDIDDQIDFDLAEIYLTRSKASM